MVIQTKLKLVGKPYQPNFPAEVVSGLGRQETMDVLLAAEHIAETLEIRNTEIPALEEKLKTKQTKADALRTKLSKPASRKIGVITIVGAVIGTCFFPVILTHCVCFRGVPDGVLQDRKTRFGDTSGGKRSRGGQ